MDDANKPKRQELLLSRLRAQRPYHELEHLFAQAFARTIFRTLLRVGVDVLIAWGGLLLVDVVLSLIWPAPPCLKSCFTPEAGGCCAVHGAVWLRLAAGAVVVFIASAASTLYVPHKPFQHSALFNVGMLLSVFFLLSGSNFLFWQRVVVLAVVFAAVFAGIKIGLRFRRRERQRAAGLQP